MKTRFVPVGIVKNSDKILIIKRGIGNRTSPGKWGYPSGSLKEFENAEDGILREIKEETGLEVKILKKGKTFDVEDNGISWIVLTFLCESGSEKVTVDMNETTDYRWISPGEIKNYDMVPGAEKDLKAVGLL